MLSNRTSSLLQSAPISSLPLESPITQDSASMNSLNDVFDNKNIDTYSSAQTSTASPQRLNNNITHNNNIKEPKFSSNSFYSGPAINSHTTKNHANRFRKSLVISPSFNSITTKDSENDEEKTSDLNIDEFSFQNTTTEEPTINIGMVISPSIRALSDILTNKVNSNSSSTLPLKLPHSLTNTTITEELTEFEDYNDFNDDENYDNAYPHDNKSTQTYQNIDTKTQNDTNKPIIHSLIDDIYSPNPTLNAKTFNNSNDTLNINTNKDLIDLNSPVVENRNFTPVKNSIKSNGMNYSDIYESYSPLHDKTSSTINDDSQNNTKNNTLNNSNKRISNRLSMMSDNFNFNDFNSPAMGYNEPIQSFNLINPSISKSLSKLSIATDSVHEIGYDDTNYDEYDEYDQDDQEESDNENFSFLPSRNGTVNDKDNNNNINKNNNNNNQSAQPMSTRSVSSSTFIQKHQSRDSIRMIDDENDANTPFTNSTPTFSNINQFEFSNNNTTPNLKTVPDLTHKETVLSNSPHRSLYDSPVLNKSPIRNTSPTFEKIKNSPTQQVKKTFINLSPKSKNQSRFTQPQSPSTQFDSKPAPKPKLTFKSLFSKKSDSNNSNKKDRKSPLLPNNEKFSSRPKSFNFTTSENKKKNVTQKEERKEKSKSLLSGWKRKSFGFSNNNNKPSPSTVLNDQLNTNTPKSPATKHNKSSSVSSLPLLNQTNTKLNPPISQFIEKSHKHSNSSPDLFNKQLPTLPPPETNTKSNDNALLMEKFGFDNQSPKSNQSPVFTQEPVLTQNVNPSWNQNPTIRKSESKQTIETSHSPIELPEPQSAKFAQTTPIINNQYENSDYVASPVIENTQPNANDDTNGSVIINSSSTYDTSGEEPLHIDTTHFENEVEDQNEMEYENFNDFQNRFEPPHALGIQNIPFERPPSISTFRNSVISNDDDRYILKTPRQATSPSVSVVASFTASPNKYHIGDDMFPKKFSIDEIESIVSLERSRSIKSIRSVSNKINNNSNSILRMVQNQNEEFDEMVLPDGMVVVRSPMFDQASILSKNNNGVSRKSSILKHSAKPSITSNIVHSPMKKVESNNTVQNDKRISMMTIEDDLNEFIDMINFDDDYDDLNSSFHIDTAMEVKLSPLRNIKRESSVPDFLGINTSYGSMNFDDFDLTNLQASNASIFNSPYQPPKLSNSPFKENESIENLIEKEENLQNDINYSTQSLPIIDSASNLNDNITSDLQKGLSGPSFNSLLKPETKSAIIGSLSKQNPIHSIEPSDSENSLSYIAQFNSVNSQLRDDTGYENNELLDDDYTPYSEYANYYNSPQASPVQSNNKYSLNNPFNDYTQSYDDVDEIDEQVIGYDYGNYDQFQADMQNNDSYQYENNAYNNDKANKRKSLNFLNKSIGNTHTKFGNNNSTASLPTYSTIKADEKPKRLTKKKNRTSISFGSMFENIIPQHIEKPSVKFSSRILLYDTYNEDDYDRKPDSATCNNLTPQTAMEIKNELNQLKVEMPVHEDSRRYTQFY